MADFYGCLESTSFQVKDLQVFLADAEVQMIQEEVKLNEGFFQVEDDNFISFGWSGQHPDVLLSVYDDEPDTEPVREIYITEVIRRHIKKGQVCQIGISGNEKLRYIGGALYWITTKGVAFFRCYNLLGYALSSQEFARNREGLPKRDCENSLNERSLKFI
jgi:hypothetical protein